MEDEKNPQYMFETIDSELLVKALSGEIDMIKLAKNEMASRGLDKSGNQVTFEKAKSIWNEK